MRATTQAARREAARAIFSRVLVGIDGSEAALDATRQAAVLADGRLALVAAWEVPAAIVGGPQTVERYELEEARQRDAAAEALREARDDVADAVAARCKAVRGTPVGTLLEEIQRDDATLVAVGSSDIGRMLGIVEGAVLTEIVHRSPCSVLVARRADASFPRRIVVGVDGSIQSLDAYAAARHLAERFDAGLHPVVAWGGKAVNIRAIAAVTGGEHEDRRGAPAEALVDAALDADLVVVGSRGLHGMRALGSVSERVAHRALCSTLVIRQPTERTT